jgi:hypothetical protein
MIGAAAYSQPGSGVRLLGVDVSSVFRRLLWTDPAPISRWSRTCPLATGGGSACDCGAGTAVSGTHARPDGSRWTTSPTRITDIVTNIVQAPRSARPDRPGPSPARHSAQDHGNVHEIVASDRPCGSSFNELDAILGD